VVYYHDFAASLSAICWASEHEYNIHTLSKQLHNLYKRLCSNYKTSKLLKQLNDSGIYNYTITDDYYKGCLYKLLLIITHGDVLPQFKPFTIPEVVFHHSEDIYYIFKYTYWMIKLKSSCLDFLISDRISASRENYQHEIDSIDRYCYIPYSNKISNNQYNILVNEHIASKYLDPMLLTYYHQYYDELESMPNHKLGILVNKQEHNMDLLSYLINEDFTPPLPGSFPTELLCMEDVFGEIIEICNFLKMMSLFADNNGMIDIKNAKGILTNFDYTHFEKVCTYMQDRSPRRSAFNNSVCFEQTLRVMIPYLLKDKDMLVDIDTKYQYCINDY
jgi:hypothetical protein